LEIYNEAVRDLLVPAAKQKKYEIKQGPDGMYVPDLVTMDVDNPEDLSKLIDLSGKNRATATTNMNDYSSRSHAILMVSVTSKNLMTSQRTFGKLTLVDLAGSERVDKTGATQERLKEAQSINKSLAALGNVMAALQSKEKHIPYRDSKLTYLLQDSLGGSSKTLMIVQVSPSMGNVFESMFSLLFASRVRNVELGPAKKNQESKEMAQLKDFVQRLEETLEAHGIAPPDSGEDKPKKIPKK